MAPNVAVGAYPFRALSLVKIFCMLKFLVDFILSKLLLTITCLGSIHSELIGHSLKPNIQPEGLL